MTERDGKTRRTAPLQTPTTLGANATQDLSGALNALLADVFALFVKTKNFHWHVSGPHFRDYHLLLDDQAAQILEIGSATCRERVCQYMKNSGDAVTLTKKKNNKQQKPESSEK